MKTNSLKVFIQLREKLQAEKIKLEARLEQINQALGLPAAAPTVDISPAPGKLSLKEAVVQATASKPLTKAEILEAINKLGYQFKTKEPLKSLNPVLYGQSPKFVRKDGYFSPAKGAPAEAGAAKRRKRTMSPAAKAKLAAIAKARWAKVRAAGKKKL